MSCEERNLVARIVQITPAYPPTISGVGDYAALLYQAFLTMGYEIKTLVSTATAETDGVLVLQHKGNTTLANALESADVVLLHFSGYGYARWGLCHWLVDGLRQWKEGSTKRRLVTLFHEVYASGPFWRTTFWTMLPQRQIALHLAQLSDAAFVTSHAGYEQLNDLHPAIPLEVLPVFSNVGEPNKRLPLLDRDPLAIVFGGSSGRSKTYQAARRAEDALAAGFDQLGITQVIDIGPGDCAPVQLAGRPLKNLGILPAQEISNCLGQSRIGLIDYPRHVLTKSGIAAAYFAHGLLMVNMSCVGVLPDDLQEGREFVGLAHMHNGVYEPQEVASDGLAWYLTHNADITAQRILKQLT